MTRKNIWVRLSNLLVPVCFILVAACVPVSDHPLTEPDPAKLDQSVFGTWYWRDSSSTGFVHMGKDEKTGLLQVYMVELKNDGDVDLSEFSGHTSEVGQGKYFNLKGELSESEPEGYIFVKYRIDRDEMSFSLPELDAVEKAIEEGKLAGEVAKGQFLNDVHITDKPENIRKFFTETKDLFQEETHLKRLKVETTEKM